MSLRWRIARWLNNAADWVLGPPEPITAAQIREAVKELEKYADQNKEQCPTCGKWWYLVRP